ncbi:MAG: hypothetical protein H0X42_12490 [Solirubrobacterales bacterium]|nr:hypothetical protein [Solirubrobacterales bacterium]
MDFKKLVDKAKKTVDDRGGIESLKADAEELKRVATGKGSLSDKAKSAAAAIKDPGAPGGEEERKPAGHGDPLTGDKPAGPGAA